MLPFTDDELLSPVQEALNRIRPSIMLDGGDVELVEIKNGIVFVRLTGACKGCPGSSTTLKNGVERQLKIDIHPQIEVMSVS